MYDNNYPNDFAHSGNQNVGGSTASGDNGQLVDRYQNNGQFQGQYYRNGMSDNTYGGASYGNSTGNYQYSNSYPNDYVQLKSEKKKEKKQRRQGGGYLKKALVSLSLGLFFGVFAGLGFYVVQLAADGGAKAKTKEVGSIIEGERVELPVTEEAASGETQANTVESDTDVRKTETVTAVVSDVTGVVETVMPSIVSINNHYTETISYFGQSMKSEGDASGSGIIVGENDKELLIVTNYHVIEDADKLTVQFVEGSEAEAQIKGTDPDMDLAVISVLAENLDNSVLQSIAVASLGDSDSLVVGEPAIAIGNSLGYGQSVTTGVISALDRNIELSNGSSGTFIQTDAAINPGNSGGALLNIKGEVIGINSNKIGGSAVEGMGYAIPISAANPIIADLMLRETVTEEERGYLGISGISVTQEVSRSYGMPEGVYITQVYDNTAASAAGLQKGDIITGFEGKTIASMDELQRELQYHAKGDTVQVTVMTVDIGGYRSKTVSLTLGNKVQG